MHLLLFAPADPRRDPQGKHSQDSMGLGDAKPLGLGTPSPPMHVIIFVKFFKNFLRPAGGSCCPRALRAVLPTRAPCLCSAIADVLLLLAARRVISLLLLLLRCCCCCCSSAAAAAPLLLLLLCSCASVVFPFTPPTHADRSPAGCLNARLRVCRATLTCARVLTFARRHLGLLDHISFACLLAAC